MFPFRDPIILVFHSSCWPKQAPQWAISFPVMNTSWRGSYQQNGSGQSEDGNTLFNDGMYFVL